MSVVCPVSLASIRTEPWPSYRYHDFVPPRSIAMRLSPPRVKQAASSSGLSSPECCADHLPRICYSLLFRIANGDMLGKDQPVILQLLDITPAMAAVKGVVMELEDCAFPLLAGIVVTDDPNVAFKDADYALLVGARPRQYKDYLQEYQRNLGPEQRGGQALEHDLHQF